MVCGLRAICSVHYFSAFKGLQELKWLQKLAGIALFHGVALLKTE